MSLRDQLEARVLNSKKVIPADKRKIMEDSTNALLAKEISKSAVKKGDKIPDFTLPNAVNRAVTLSEVLKNKMAVITFYRGGWCPYCNMELKAFESLLPAFEEKNVQLIAISPEVPDISLSTKEKNELSFEVLSDVDNKVAKDFGLVFKMPEDLQDLYLNSFNIHVAKHNGNDDFELPMPATYVVNQNGDIIYDFIHEDYTKRAEPSEILSFINSL